MIIKTKFNIGQEVFFLKGRKVCSGGIAQINVDLAVLDERPCEREKKCGHEKPVIEECRYDNVKLVRQTKYKVGSWWYRESELKESESELIHILINIVGAEDETI